ncbi:MAG TPA: 3-hydroxyacyl-CoA dehydrogenase family protein [Anaerovoracaceae bacterium]|nr:3-hydroxyacyl-CoA dehydrogenase family protein [Anaerovoracaceae bacterium]
MVIKKVAMVGAGTMGNQIAMQVAICGFEVYCYSRKEATVANARSYSDVWFAKSVEKGKLTDEAADQAKSRLKFTTDLKEAVTDADIVIEAVSDVLKTKKEILGKIDQYTPDHTIYASNSSYIVSSLFADAVKHPENVLNVHFFNPALVMKLVEVVQGPHVSDDTVETVFEFIKSISKIPVLVRKEIYGFIVNRIFSAITKEACYMLDQGVASIEDVDTAVKNGLGHPMGPFELLDMTGIDLGYDVLMEKYKMTGDLSDKPSPAIVERYARQEYGRKSKKGFYNY